MLRIIGCCGFIGSGKDSVARHLVQQYNFQKLSFAGALKDAVAVIFDWPREMLEGDTRESRIWRDQVDEWWAARLNMPHLTPRWTLQHWGTEVCRVGFHTDIWSASLENKLCKSKSDVVITDCRFPNEVDQIKKNNGKTIWIKRGSLPEWYQTGVLAAQGDRQAIEILQEKKIHASEWSWLNTDFDFVIENNGSLIDLYSSVDVIINNFNSQQLSHLAST